MQDPGTVGEERRITLSEVKSSLIQFCEGGNETRGRPALVDGKSVHGREEVTVGEICKALKTRRHFTSISRDFSGLGDWRYTSIDRAIDRTSASLCERRLRGESLAAMSGFRVHLKLESG